MTQGVVPGPVGRDPDEGLPGFMPLDTPAVVGLEQDAEPLAGQPKITRVTRDWGDPPTVNATFTPQIGGTTLKEALAELQRLDEWGTGGGNLKGTGENDQVQLTTTDGKNYTVELKGEFILTLPKWSGYDAATPAQKKSWDAMIANLRKHEEEHVAIQYRGWQKLIRTLTNLPVTQATSKLQESQDETQAKQKEFDTATEHGGKAVGGFPKVELDVSADPPPKASKPAGP
jgi:hypothetical protein